MSGDLKSITTQVSIKIQSIIICEFVRTKKALSKSKSIITGEFVKTKRASSKPKSIVTGEVVKTKKALSGSKRLITLLSLSKVKKHYHSGESIKIKKHHVVNDKVESMVFEVSSVIQFDWIDYV